MNKIKLIITTMSSTAARAVTSGRRHVGSVLHVGNESSPAD